MAKRKGATKNDLLNAIRYFGYDASPRMTKAQLRKEWGKVRKEQKELGVDVPRLDTIIKEINSQDEFDYEQTPRNDNMETLPPENTIDLGYDYIQQYKATIDTVYQDTLVWMNRQDNTTSERQREYLAHHQHESDLTASYYSLLSLVDGLVLEFGYDSVADAISKDAEIYYTIALVFTPPSNFDNLFETTIEQLRGIMLKIGASYENI